MKNDEMRELDAWVAEYVMGCNLDWHRGLTRDEPHCTCAYTKEDKPSGIVMPYPHAEYRGDGRGLGTFGPSPTKLMRYTADPAAAMMVLEKCVIKRLEAYDQYCPDVTFQIMAPHEDWDNEWIVAADAEHSIRATAPTLPLAICLFARQLFTDQKQKI